MRVRPKSKTLILVPLTVMLILTLVLGGTAYQLTHTWEQAISKETENLTQALILNNIRWNLRQTQQLLETDPKEARETWDNVKQQVAMISPSSENGQAVAALRSFLDQDGNIEEIDTILKQDFFSINVNRTQNFLMRQQVYSRSVTLTTTLSMLVLGLVLMFVTARDLNKLIRDLADSRDLAVSLQEEERRRIAQDLHDEVIQELIDVRRSYAPEKLDRLVESIRRICHNLKPQILEDLGLPAALELLADELREDGQRDIHLSMEDDKLGKLAKVYELTLFRVVQELFNNVKRHAQASQVSLTLVYEPQESPLLRLYVRDNGRGFDPKAKSQGMGLAGVRERIQRLEGHITIDSKPGEGSRFQMMVPIRHEAADTASY